MKKLVFATNNEHKLYEVKKMLSGFYKVIGLKEAGIHEDIPENEPTLDGNAKAKAQYVWDKLKLNVFADDTGLEIDALNGEPGVYSARYAGPDKNSIDNMKLVLEKMGNTHLRSAQFRTSICLILEGNTYYFEGKVVGSMLESPRGTEGFGYDPIFQPQGYTVSFAEMPLDEKNKISHRGRAISKLIDFLKTTEVIK